MITIQRQVWRSECIACIGMIDEDDSIFIQPVGVNPDDSEVFEYDTAEEAVAEFKRVVEQWQADLKILTSAKSL